MANHAGMKLGKRTAFIHPAVPLLARMMADTPLPPAPATLSTDQLVTSWPMLGNDQVGDCTIAGALHVIQLWHAMAGNPVMPDDTAALADYSAATGYIPGNPSTDNGAIETDILNYWRSTGLSVNETQPADQIDGWATVNTRNWHEIATAIYAFGAIYAGVLLPISAQSQDTWNCDPNNLTGDNEPGSWGGHAIPLVGYNKIGPVCITWGAPKQMTWAWWGCYADEAHAVLSHDMMTAAGLSGRGIAWDALAEAMKALPSA